VTVVRRTKDEDHDTVEVVQRMSKRF